jgi:superfamily II DNA/RNA helicase/very-short-patch-repair endonuclease
MNVFETRHTLVSDYSSFVTSYINIRDLQIKKYVEQELTSGALWPDPLVQLNPSFVYGESIDALVDSGILHEQCRRIFRAKRNREDTGSPMRLYKHQEDAVRIAAGGHSYVLTTGTGSGKSLAYIIPIVNHVLQHGSGKGIQAIIVYPMNALANSQVQELEKFLNYGYLDGHGPVTFARYTRQESEERRNEIKENPPDILLTNYVMLELILTRHDDRPLVRAAKDLSFLVLDELHTYRGRQGSDVAMLVRRARDAFSASNLQCIGTSATLAAGENQSLAAQEVAHAASEIFGTIIDPTHVIGETLNRVSQAQSQDDASYIQLLRKRVEAESHATPRKFEEFIRDPLVSWIESALGVAKDPDTGKLVRQHPRSITGKSGIAKDLSDLIGLDERRCQLAIEEALLAGNECLRPDGEPAFAFRLHQFISRGDTVYASLDSESDPKRYVTLQGQKYVPGDRGRVLLPLVFCRECGQAYYCVWRATSKNGDVMYRPRNLRETHGLEGEEPGFLFRSEREPWSENLEDVLDRLPDDWLDRDGRLRKDRRKSMPIVVRIRKNGVESPDGEPWAFIHSPFHFCLTCRVSYDFSSQKTDFPKLSLLGTEGRSTATTILALAATRQEEDYASRKLLSFTDNRQDASLQAGHFNDFIQVGLLRSALYRAVKAAGKEGINHDSLAQRVFDYLGFPFEEFAHDPGLRGQAKSQTEAAMREVLAYRLYRDLRHGWRVLSPNLEQVGLLNIDYPFLRDACEDDEIWSDAHPALAGADPSTREAISRALLDHMRHSLAIRVDYLDPKYQERLLQQSHQYLAPPWGFDESETLKRLCKAPVLVPRSRKPGDRRDTYVYLSSRSGFGRYLRRTGTIPNYSEKLTLADTDAIILDILEALRRHGLVTRIETKDLDKLSFQLNASAMVWRVGNGTSIPRDIIRRPTGSSEGANPNEYFLNYYRSVAMHTQGISAREHTAQVPSDVRQQREEEFRSGKLPILFCSPTMELGIDIAQLNLVNMRNVPPTPANYAQRSGRAGRNGQPALVFTYCSGGSPHDRYFFRHTEAMVSGAVSPPRIDLTNEALLRAHIHAIWLSETGLELGTTLADILDMNGDPPALAFIESVKNALRDEKAKQRAKSRAQYVLDTMTNVLADADWYHDNWLNETINQIPLRFDRACARWRDLYLSAYKQAKRQGAIARDASRPAEDKKRAMRLQHDAYMQLQLLTEPRSVMRSDFYSYRYFASEGFLPGYNFPRLPLSAYIPGRQKISGDEEFLSRPRFLAITEFGPHAIIYHEGSQYEINQVMLPAGAEEELQTGAAKICEECGYLHPCTNGEGPDKCEMCGADLPAVTSPLFHLQNVVTRKREHITCDEEERRRMGYRMRTVVRFAERDGTTSYRDARLIVDKEEIAAMQEGQAATLWRINLGWRRSSDPGKKGFVLDIERGYWAREKNEKKEDDDPMSPRTQRVIPYVEDSKNCLIFRPTEKLDHNVMASLQAALKSAIQRVYELEDRELAAEPLPDRDHRRSIIFYEATEGGLGVLRRLLDTKALRRVARKSLEICHFDPDSGEDLHRAPGAKEDCEAACYDCLLSYTNQRDHELLDRRLIKDFLIQLSRADVAASPRAIPREEHLKRLLNASDSQLERDWLQFVDNHHLRLPSRAQRIIESCKTQPDFTYDDQSVAIYVDGPHHDYPERAARDREQVECMEDLGWMVLRFSYKDDWARLVDKYRGIFGGGK